MEERDPFPVRGEERPVGALRRVESTKLGSVQAAHVESVERGIGDAGAVRGDRDPRASPRRQLHRGRGRPDRKASIRFRRRTIRHNHLTDETPRATGDGQSRRSRARSRRRCGDGPTSQPACCYRTGRFAVFFSSSSVAQLEPCIGNVVKPLARIARKAPLQETAHSRRCFRRKMYPVHFRTQYRSKRVRDVIALKRSSSGQHLVRRPHRTPRCRRAGQLFGPSPVPGSYKRRCQG